MLHVAAKAFWPAPIPFPVLHVDTGHNFPEVLAYRDATVERLGLRLEVASVQDWIDDGRLRERADGTRNPLQTQPLLDAIATAPLRRRLRRRPARRGEGARQGARRQPARRLRPVGPQEPAPRAVEPLQPAAPPRRARAGLPAVELDRARRVALHRARGHRAARRSTTPTSARSSSATACCSPSARCSQPRAGETRRHPPGALPHRRRHVVHRRRRERRGIRRRRRHRGGRLHADRARRHPRRRPDLRGRHGGPQEGGLLLMHPMTFAHARVPRSRMGAWDPAPIRHGDPAMSTLLRLATAGSVDDGKSTLVGRLLHDTKSVLSDQLDAVERVSRDRGLASADLALLTDGLRAEREQGITIDVAYRYFATAQRSFVLADCPGHVQYTRNTVTGSSTADAARAARRRPQGRARADPPPPRRRRADAGAARRRRGQQDRPRRLTARTSSARVAAEVRAHRRRARHPRRPRHAGLGARRRQRRRPVGATRPGTTARRLLELLETLAARHRPGARVVPDAGAGRHPPPGRRPLARARRVPRVRRPARLRLRAGR